MAEYGCVMIKLEVPKSFHKIFDIIDENDLAGDGVEKETHVTVCYGLHSDVKTSQVREVLEGADLREIEVVGASLFENETDVLKLDVKVTDVLFLLRNKILQLNNTQKFNDYKPHITIAYLKKGKGSKYLPTNPEFNLKFKVKDLVYSYPNRAKQEIIYESLITGKKLL